MLSDTSSSTDADSAVHKPKHQWGPLSALWFGAVIFLVPQLVIGEGALLLHWHMQNQDLQQFYMYGGAVAITLVLLSVLLRRRYGVGFQELGLSRFHPKYIAYALLALPLYMITSSILTSVVGALYKNFNVGQQQNIGFTTGSLSGVELIAVFISLVILPPLVEELLFRGFLLGGMRRRFHPVVAVILTSLIFAAAHGQLNVGVDVFALSLFLCYMRIKTGSLWPSIFLHATKNFIAFSLVYLITPAHLEQVVVNFFSR